MVATGLTVTPNLRVFDTKTGLLTREGFLLLQGLNTLLNNIATELVGDILEDTITNGTTTKAPTSNAVFDALALKQPLDADLTSIAALTTTAYGRSVLEVATAAALRTLAGTVIGTDVFTQRTITGTASQVSVSNGNGVSGNPTIGLSVGNILIGSWTPTLTGGANVDAVTAFLSYYVRIGDHAICWGPLQVDPTAAADTATTVRISVPIASNFGSSLDGRGVATTFVAQRAGVISADSVNDTVNLDFASEVTANTGFSFVFGYRII